jgi:hypothetical protein
VQHQIYAQQVAVATITQYAKATVQKALQELQSSAGAHRVNRTRCDNLSGNCKGGDKCPAQAKPLSLHKNPQSLSQHLRKKLI